MKRRDPQLYISSKWEGNGALSNNIPLYALEDVLQKMAQDDEG